MVWMVLMVNDCDLDLDHDDVDVDDELY